MTPQQIAQALMNKLSTSLKARRLHADLEREPDFTGQYWQFGSAFTYQGIECRVCVTVFTDPNKAARIRVSARSNEWPEWMGYRWGSDCESVAELLQHIPDVIHQAQNEDEYMRNYAVADAMREYAQFKAHVDSGEFQRKIDEIKWGLAEEAEHNPSNPKDIPS